MIEDSPRERLRIFLTIVCVVALVCHYNGVIDLRINANKVDNDIALSK